MQRTQDMIMTDTTTMSIYLTGLKNQHAVETQAIGTIQNELPRMTAYPELHAKMQEDKTRSTEQAARLDRLPVWPEAGLPIGES